MFCSVSQCAACAFSPPPPPFRTATSRACLCCSVLQCVAVCCSVLQCVAVCCSPAVPRCVAVCCSVLQCVTVCGSVWQCVAVCCCSALQFVAACQTEQHTPSASSPVACVLQCVAVCCSVLLQCIAVFSSVSDTTTPSASSPVACVLHFLMYIHHCYVLQCVAVYCSVLQRVAVCCSVLQCVAVRAALCCANTLQHTAAYTYLSWQLPSVLGTPLLPPPGVFIFQIQS